MNIVPYLEKLLDHVGNLFGIDFASLWESTRVGLGFHVGSLEAPLGAKWAPSGAHNSPSGATIQYFPSRSFWGADKGRFASKPPEASLS